MKLWLRDLNADAKLIYGNTLLKAVSENSGYRRSFLSTTLCEDKKSLKDRLSAILKAGRKPKRVIILSIIIALILCGTAICLGAFSGYQAGERLLSGLDGSKITSMEAVLTPPGETKTITDKSRY